LTAKSRKQERVDNFFKGKARAAYRLAPELDESLSSLETSFAGEQAVEDSEELCKRGCTEILRQLADVFHAVGCHNAKTEETYAKSYPKEGEHKNITAQNQWMRESLFDAYGNYLYCTSCISRTLGVNRTRLSRLRVTKVHQYQEPIKAMTKKEVVENKLESFVLHPGLDSSTVVVSEWWKSLNDMDEVEVKYPYERHGLAGQPSNRSKLAVKEAFLTFVYANSPQYFFVPKFTRIDPPKPGEKDFETKANSSVVWIFNRTQGETGGGTCSAFAAREWLKYHRSKVALHPHKSDYCDTCKYRNEEVSRQQAILKRLSQSGSAQEEQLRDVEAKIEAAEEELRIHKEEASASRDYFNEMIKKCATQWKEIEELAKEQSPSQETVTKLVVAKHTFTLVISADYQQSKLIPHWGRTEQPGSTYYLQKVPFDIFGLVDHRSKDLNYIWIFNETIGPKNTDHTIAFLSQHLERVTSEFPWVRRACIFLDNAGNTNKNRFLFSWAMELVQKHTLDHCRFCFLLAGHTKFSPDRLFTLTGNEYNRSDVFTAEELLQICQKFSTASIATGSSIFDWRSAMAKKYSDLPGVRKMHDFLIVRSINDRVVMKVRASCHSGNAIESPLRVVDSSQTGSPTGCYDDHTRPIAAEKLGHVLQMCSRYIPPSRWPSYIPSATPQPSPLVPASANLGNGSAPAQVRLSAHTSRMPSAATGQHQPGLAPEIPPAKKAKKCGTPGCDGSGHRNNKHWNEGHTTKAGCPRHRR
jgi:hypothetical protein